MHTRRSPALEPLPTARWATSDGTRTRRIKKISHGNEHRSRRLDRNIVVLQIPDTSWDGTPYTPKAINVRLPELTGEIYLVSIDIP